MDVVIIGAGLAGLTASVKLAEEGANVSLISPSYSERSQSVMAMGGINACLNTKGENDSIENHFNDTINGGLELNNRKAVLKLCSNAPKIVAWLEKLGASFTRDENNNIDLRYFGGQKHRRTAYAGARTGKQLVSTLVGKCRQKEAEGIVKRHVGWRFLSLIIDDGKCHGTICINENTDELKAFKADAVIIASGGLNKLFGRTSGSIQNDGFATAELFLQGVELANLEMIQYHPTTVNAPQKRILITEAARGEGGKLFVIRNGKPWYFMKEWYPELGELMPRDVVSRSIFKASDGGKETVYLDISHLDEDLIKTKLDEVYEVCMNYLNLDPTKELIPIYPGVHYFMGGIKTDENHKTNLKALYAAGECSCQYHGANRLGGNSLLGAIYGGYAAAKSALSDFKSSGVEDLVGVVSSCGVEDIGDVENSYGIEDDDNDEENLVQKELDLQLSLYEKWFDLNKVFKDYNYSNDSYVKLAIVEEKLSNIMNKSMGIYRNGEDLNKALIELNELEKLKINTYGNYYDFVSIKALIILAKACISSALERKESRGAHQRMDYPDMDDNYLKTTSVLYESELGGIQEIFGMDAEFGGIKVSFEEAEFGGINVSFKEIE